MKKVLIEPTSPFANQLCVVSAEGLPDAHLDGRLHPRPPLGLLLTQQNLCHTRRAPRIETRSATHHVLSLGLLHNRTAVGRLGTLLCISAVRPGLDLSRTASQYVAQCTMTYCCLRVLCNLVLWDWCVQRSVARLCALEMQMTGPTTLVLTLGSHSSTSRAVHMQSAPKLLRSSVTFLLLRSSALVGSLLTPTKGMLSPRKWLADRTVPSPPTDMTKSTCRR